MNKDIKTTSNIVNDISYPLKKLEYLEMHSALLEKENENLKYEKTTVEMQLESYKQGLNVSIPATKKILKDAIITIKMNKKLNKELTSKLQEVNTLLSELNNNKISYVKHLDRSVDKILSKFGKVNK